MPMPPIHWDTILTGLISAAIIWGMRTMKKVIKNYGAESREWRLALDTKLDAITDATQTTMRTQLLHMSEKYLTRGWVTPEERAALCDMHAKYAALHANGYIDGYMARVEKLPDREI